MPLTDRWREERWDGGLKIQKKAGGKEGGMECERGRRQRRKRRTRRRTRRRVRLLDYVGLG